MTAWILCQGISILRYSDGWEHTSCIQSGRFGSDEVFLASGATKEYLSNSEFHGKSSGLLHRAPNNARTGQLDTVARERKYLALLQAPPLDATRSFILANIANHVFQFVAIKNDLVVGWCDISPLRMEGFQHRGELGMGVHPQYRGLGIGQQLAKRTIQEARANGLERLIWKHLLRILPLSNCMRN